MSVVPMDADTFTGDKDFLCGDFFNDLTNEGWSSLLDVADASPSEILADAALMLVPPISPVLTATPKSSPNESCTSDSGSEDDSKISSANSQDRQSSVSPLDWLNEPDNSRQHLNLDDIEEFLQKNNFEKKNNEPTTQNVHTGPIMSIENGVIKIEGLKIERDNIDERNNNLNTLSTKIVNSIGNVNIQNPYFNVVNEYVVNTHTKIPSKEKPNILRKNKCHSVTNTPQVVVPATCTNGGKIAITPLQTKSNCNKLRKLSASPPTRNIVISNSAVSVNNVSNTIVQTASIPCIELGPTSPNLELSHLSDAEIRAIKKQQRMIKNREAACQSRQKRKDYVSALEHQLMEAHQEIGRLRLENKLLKDQLETGCGRSRKIPRLDTAYMIPKKNIAVIFAMVFMVSLNFNVLGWNNKPLAAPSEMHHGTRHLLWNEENNSNEIIDYDQLSNRSLSSNCANSSKFSTYINQTESIRIAGELSRWIGRGKTLNWTHEAPRRKRRTYFNDEDKINGGLIDSTYKLFEKLNLDSTFMHFHPPAKSKTLRDRSRFRKFRRNRMMEYDDSMDPPYDVYPRLRKRDGLEELDDWGAVLRALRRRDDTFYVVNVGSGEHLLLPAVSHNGTTPPKMALILPAKIGNDSLKNEHVTLMQIDCSVLNTTLVKLKSDMLPVSARSKGGEKNPQTQPTQQGPQLRNTKDNVHDSIYLQNTVKNASNFKTEKQMKMAEHPKKSKVHDNTWHNGTKINSK